jgi:hypothetical protein
VTVLHTGSTKEYSENWQQIFGNQKTKSAAKRTSKTKPPKRTARAKSAKKKSK